MKIEIKKLGEDFTRTYNGTPILYDRVLDIMSGDEVVATFMRSRIENSSIDKQIARYEKLYSYREVVRIKENGKMELVR